MTEITFKITYETVDLVRTQQDVVDSIRMLTYQILNIDLDGVIAKPTVEIIEVVFPIDKELLSKKNWIKFKDREITSRKWTEDGVTFKINKEKVTIPKHVLHSGTFCSKFIKSRLRWIKLHELLNSDYEMDYSINNTDGDDDVMYYSEKFKKVFFIEHGDNINQILKY